MRLILFDIDGTLIRSGGAGKLAMESALAAAFGLAEVLDGVPYAGRTDRAIGHDLLALHGIDPLEHHRQNLHAAYLAVLPDSLARVPGTVLPGVRALLDALRGEPVAVGLITGNLRAGAEVKLRHFGLWDYFPFGGYGDAHLDRDGVARDALAAAESLHARPFDDIWVVGDTPLDVACARTIGAKSLAVATGWHTPEALAESRPDWLLADLADTESLLAAFRAR